MNDILKQVQEEWDKLMGCDIERDDKDGFNAVYRGHQHDRDRAVAIAILEADVKRLNERMRKVLKYSCSDEDFGFNDAIRDEITYKQQAINELKNN